MSNITISHETMSIQEIENYLTEISVTLEDYARIQAEQDGKKDGDLTEAVFTAKLLTFVKVKVQLALDFIKQKVLIASHVIHVQAIEQTAKRQSEEKQRAIDNKIHRVQALERLKNSLTPDPFKYVYSRWLLPLATFVGLADATMAFTSFRSASYSTTLALITSIAIGLVIAGSHVLYAPWILSSKAWNRILKVAPVLAAAFSFFYWISSLRVAGMTNTISITVTDAGAASPPHISQSAICGISFILFTSVLLLSLVLWMTKAERAKLHEYQTVVKELQKNRQEIATLTKEINDINHNTLQQKKQARMAYDYITRSFQIAKNSGRVAIAEYKRSYANFHPTVPDFFPKSHELDYDESLHFSTPEKATT